VCRNAFAILAAGAALVAAACGSGAAHRPASQRPAPHAPGPIALTSTFGPGGTIPRAYTCDGHDFSPPLRAAGVPGGAVELLIVMRDHDASGGDFIHWAIAHVSPRVVASGEAGSVVLAAGHVPSGAVLGRNSFGSLGYRGPCPPSGDPPHHYEITVSALGQASRLSSGFSPPAAGKLDALARGSLTGVYARH
jgi:Raf kinase inhibitor-like YbhB/YbcL family protein